MTSARGLFRVHLLLGVLAVGAMSLSGVVAVRAVDFTALSPSDLVALCQRALVPNLELQRVALLVLASLGALVAFRAARSAARQLRDTRRFLRALSVVGRVGTAQAASVIDDSRPLAFCAGYFRCRIFVSSGTLVLLSKSQLDAVLGHEAHHARRHDPLRMLVAQTIADAAFFVPVLRRTRERYAVLAELAADDAAMRISGRTGPLAAALLAFDAHGGSAAGVAPERVDHLTGRRTGWDVPFRDVANGLLTIVALGAVAAATALMPTTSGLAVASVVLTSCTILVSAAPALFTLAGFQLFQRRRIA